MLKKIAVIIILSISFAGINSGKAETVSQKEASRLAGLFFNAANGRVMSAPKLVYNGKKLTTDRLFSPFYIYNLPAGGFVIISAENKAMPILGFSLKENFEPDNIQGSLEALLKEYARDIEAVRYESNVPEKAIKAWNNLPEYIHDVLSAEYIATDILLSDNDTNEIISNLETTGKWVDVDSEIYTPEQWMDMINLQLDKEGNVAIGFVSKDRVYPSVVHGRKGDLYRISLERDNDWLMRLSSTEFYNNRQIADLNDIFMENAIVQEEPSFNYYESILKSLKEENAAKEDLIVEKLNPSKPILRNVGGGRYEIVFPERIQLARIYNLAGSMVNRQEYKSTSVAHINLEGQPYGIYFVLISGESGKSYGFKLTR